MVLFGPVFWQEFNKYYVHSSLFMCVRQFVKEGTIYKVNSEFSDPLER